MVVDGACMTNSGVGVASGFGGFVVFPPLVLPVACGKF